MTDPTPPTEDAADDIFAIDRTSRVAEAFAELLVEHGYPSISEYMLQVLQDEAAKRREARLRSIGGRMFLDGAADRVDDG